MSRSCPVPQVRRSSGVASNGWILPKQHIDQQAHVMTSVTDTEAEALARQIETDAGLRAISEISRFKAGLANHVYRVNQRSAVRIGTSVDGPSFPKSVAILQAIEGQAKTPTLLYADLTRTRIPFNAMVYTSISGDELDGLWTEVSISEKYQYVCQIGFQLKLMHTIPFEELREVQENTD